MKKCFSYRHFAYGYTAIDWAQLQGGETVAVFGCGPVGLMAMKCAWLRGAKRVIGIDIEHYRSLRRTEPQTLKSSMQRKAILWRVSAT